MCKKRYLIALTFAVVLLAGLGSVFDLQIAQAVYFGERFKENPFGIIFAFIGIIPTFVGWSFLGASILYLARKKVEEKKKRGWLTALAVLLFVLSFFYFCNTLFLVNASAFSVHWSIAYSIGLAVIIGAAYLGYVLSKNSDNAQLLNRLLFLTVVSLVTMVVTMLTKELMCRPRYRFVLGMDNIDYFRNWWQSGRAIKESMNTEVVGDEFASFPSGHSSYAMFAIFIFPALAEYNKRLEKYRGALFLVGIVWWALTAFSRMTVGAHYLTDVSIAGLVTIGAYALVRTTKGLLERKKNVKALPIEKE